MAYHWKYGDGFAIRYGGKGGIKWFFGDQYKKTADTHVLPPTHPATVSFDAVTSATQILEWWEIRRQTNLQIAQFEERRVQWLMEMFNEWALDLSKEQTIKIDTTCYFELELIKFINKLKEIKQVDIPAILLLQLDRATHTLTDLNLMLFDIIKAEAPNFVMEGRPSFEYTPFYDLDIIENQEAVSDYSAVLDDVLIAIGAAQLLKEAVGVSDLVSYSIGAVLGFVHNQAKKSAKSGNRRSEVEILLNLLLELKSAKIIQTILANMPPKLLSFTVEDILQNKLEPDVIELSSPPKILRLKAKS